MSNRWIIGVRAVAGLALLVSVAVLAGCFETNYSLGSKDAAVVDVAYCGDWNVVDKEHPTDPPSVRMFIRNLDGKQYFVEWTEAGKNGEADKSLRMIGFTAEVNGATFAHLRDLPEDGTIPEKHLIMRVGLKDGVLTLRNLDEKFFTEHNPVQSDAELRRVIEQNLDNDAMYDSGTVTAVRPAGK